EHWPRHRTVAQVTLDGALRLVHRDGDEDDLDLLAKTLFRGRDLRLERLAERAPRRPELEDDRFLPDPLAEVDGVALEVLDRHRGGRRAHFDAHVLRVRRPRSGQQNRRGRERERTAYCLDRSHPASGSHSTIPIWMK